MPAEHAALHVGEGRRAGVAELGATLWPRRSRPTMPPVISMIVPAYDEAERLPGTLDRMRRWFDAQGEDYEVIVVDDGSDDGTQELVRSLCQQWPQLGSVRLRRNSGKGCAVRAGMLVARAQHRAFSDADLSTPIEELPRLRAVLRDGVEVAIGSRAAAGAEIEVHQHLRREMMGRTYNRLLRALVLPGIHDTQCGFKVFTARAARACFEPLRTMRFGFDAEVLVRARRQGWRIAEVPVRWSHVEASRVDPIRDASSMLVDLLRLRFGRLG